MQNVKIACVLYLVIFFLTIETMRYIALCHILLGEGETCASISFQSRESLCSANDESPPRLWFSPCSSSPASPALRPSRLRRRPARSTAPLQIPAVRPLSAPPSPPRMSSAARPFPPRPTGTAPTTSRPCPSVVTP